MRHKGLIMQSIRQCLTTTKLIRDESGQTIVVFSFMLIAMLALAGFVIDIGRAMVVNNQLRTTTIASALAGANEMPNGDYATVAMTYSACTAPPAGSGITTGCTANQHNASSWLGTVTTAATGYCSSFVASALNISCTNMGSGRVNALVVTQTVTMPTLFMKIVGIPSLTFSESQTAAWKGAARNPYNVAVIVDASGSMNTVDAGSDGCNNSQAAFACALYGVQTFLEKLTPCSGSGNCDSGTNALDKVALYAFPGLSNAQAVSDDVNCNTVIKPANVSFPSDGGFGENDTTVYYGFPGSSFTGSALTPNPPIYQLVGFSSDYRESNATSSLDGDSTLVKAVGGGGTPNCRYVPQGYYYKSSAYGKGNAGNWGGIQAAGGADTYYAGILYQAQSDLYSEYQARLNPPSGSNAVPTQTSNVIVILSDGDANASSTNLGGMQGVPYCQSYSWGWPRTCLQWGTQNQLTANNNRSGTFPSYNHQCQQAITAAQAATNGTWPTSQSSSTPVKTTVFTVAYGSETGTCPGESLSPCDTMREMASSYTTMPSQQDADFYSDYLATHTGNADTSCTSSNGVTSIPDIFQDIASTLSASKVMRTPPGCSANNTSVCN
jgi:Flp pilus assembly protein TadG